jgi:hypothetical protein
MYATYTLDGIGFLGFVLIDIGSYVVFVLGSLLMVRRQRVQMLTLRATPLISRRRCCTFSTKRRRVRFCEKLELLPYNGLRSHISQRPDIFIILSIQVSQGGVAERRSPGGAALFP